MMNKKQQVTELWRRCFEDTDEFIRFYFDRKYRDENSLVYEENGKALSALQMLPYPMNWKHVTLQTSYISGACTLPEARNRGIMGMLLRTAFQEMYRRKIEFSTLIPAGDGLFGYYARLGYVAVFDYSTCRYNPSEPLFSSRLAIISPEHYQAEFAISLFPYFERQMRKYDCCIQHPLEDYLSILEDAYFSGGRLWAVYQENAPAGWALAVPERDRIMVKEHFFDTSAARDALLQAISQTWPLLPLVCKTLPSPSGARHLGMARLVHAAEMLQHYAQANPKVSFTVKLNDPQLPSNDGIYILENGHCHKTAQTTGPTDCETDIPTLTRALLGYHTGMLPAPLNRLFSPAQPYMNLMLD